MSDTSADERTEFETLMWSDAMITEHELVKMDVHIKGRLYWQGQVAIIDDVVTVELDPDGGVFEDEWTGPEEDGA